MTLSFKQNEEARPIYEKLCSGGWKVNKFITRYILKFCLVKKKIFCFKFWFSLIFTKTFLFKEIDRVLNWPFLIVNKSDGETFCKRVGNERDNFRIIGYRRIGESETWMKKLNFVVNMRNPSTVRKTTTDDNKAISWLQSKYETRDLCDIPPGELNTYWPTYSMTATKENGDLSPFNAASIVFFGWERVQLSVKLRTESMERQIHKNGIIIVSQSINFV